MADERKFLTLLVVPDTAGAEVKRLRVPKVLAYIAGLVGATTFTAFVGLVAHDFHLMGRLSDLPGLESENAALRAELDGVQTRLEQTAQTVERVSQFDARLRQITMLSDPERNLAMGPVGAVDAPAAAPSAAAAEDLKRDLLGARSSGAEAALMDQRIGFVSSEASELEGRVKSLLAYLENQQDLLASTPSLLPARGWLTSGFGWRTDPYTGMVQMHAGLDVSANIGQPVVATGDGTVIEAGKQGAYGNLIAVSHGKGIASHYAHLSKILVKLGESVKRGQVIGHVGNTGRSTGPHLHYEIRLNGIPKNPESFILE